MIPHFHFIHIEIGFKAVTILATPFCAFSQAIIRTQTMRVAIRELALLVAVAAGSAEAFAPAPVGLSLRTSGVAPQRVVNAQAVPAGVAGLTAALKNADKIGKIVPKTWKEGTDYSRASKVCHISSYPASPPLVQCNACAMRGCL